jgi:branched-chain amino acid transport system substrate-binding protein
MNTRKIKYVASGLLTGTVALAPAACGSSSSSGSASSDSGTISIGIVTPTSGSYAIIGKYVVDGATLAVDRINAAGGVDGKKLKLVVEDEKLDPVQTVKDMRDLSAKGINIAYGFGSSADCLAAQPVAKQLNMVFMGSCNDNSLVSDHFDPHFFQVAASLDSLTNATTSFIKGEFPSTKAWNMYSLDYVTGHTQVDSFKTALTKAVPDATFGKEVYAPLDATDVRSYVGSVKDAAASDGSDGLYVYAYGGADVAFLKQAAQADVYSKYSAVVNVAGDVISDEGVGAQLKPTWNIYDYFYKAYDNPANKQFIADFQSKYHQPPVAWAAQADIAIDAYAAALKKTGGSTDGDVMIKALEGLQFDSVKGPVTFRASDHVLEQSVTAYQCKGDSSSDNGISCDKWKVIPTEDVLPPSQVQR